MSKSQRAGGVKMQVAVREAETKPADNTAPREQQYGLLINGMATEARVVDVGQLREWSRATMIASIDLGMIIERMNSDPVARLAVEAVKLRLGNLHREQIEVACLSTPAK